MFNNFDNTDQKTMTDYQFETVLLLIRELAEKSNNIDDFLMSFDNVLGENPNG